MLVTQADIYIDSYLLEVRMKGEEVKQEGATYCPFRCSAHNMQCKPLCKSVCVRVCVEVCLKVCVGVCVEVCVEVCDISFQVFRTSLSNTVSEQKKKDQYNQYDDLPLPLESILLCHS